MKTFLIFGKSSPKELKELSLKYKAEIVRLVKDTGGDVGSMYVMLEKYMILISAFPGMKTAEKASITLTKFTGISFRTLPVIPVDEFYELTA